MSATVKIMTTTRMLASRAAPMLVINCHWMLLRQIPMPYPRNIIVLRKVYTLAYPVNPVI
ncbi:hypothetical protein D3C76_1179620 [compost metagenome]